MKCHIPLIINFLEYFFELFIKKNQYRTSQGTNSAIVICVSSRCNSFIHYNKLIFKFDKIMLLLFRNNPLVYVSEVNYIINSCITIFLIKLFIVQSTLLIFNSIQLNECFLFFPAIKRNDIYQEK